MSASTPSHRSRRKKVTIAAPSERTPTTADIVTVDNKTNVVKPEFPLVAFLWPARGTTSQWILIPLILIAVGLFRWTVGFWGYSGFQKLPMHGDFEAQRHWMEITIHLPVSSWYFYDLPYWGLDYPPLTAYHSWLCGQIGCFFKPNWFALQTSRGLEDQLLKVYMRATVVISEYLVYIPALIVFLRHYARANGVGATSASVALVAILMQPATILIDHGHFQYNAVMLGFVVAAISSIYAGRLLWACVFFVAGLGFKQMALYYAPVFFAYLLGSCLTPKLRPGLLIGIGLTTLVAFAIVFAPLLLGALYDHQRGIVLTDITEPPLFDRLPASLKEDSWLYASLLQVAQCIHRCFPFARGLFEDKVANFWCLLNTLYKVRKLESIIALPRLAAYLTFMSILAPTMIIGANPRKDLLPYALASCAWGFFLFSYQVHEKSVLLPLLPMTLLLGSKDGLSKEYRAWVGYANVLGVWTMFPLLKRDELITPYVVITLLWLYLLGLPPTSVSAYYDSQHENVVGRPMPEEDLATPTKILHFQSYILMAFWHLLEHLAEPPEDKPDLWPVVNACFGALSFGICYMWCTWQLIVKSGLLDDYFSFRKGEGPWAAAKSATKKQQ